MVKPMIAVATLNLMGVRMHSPPFARHLAGNSRFSQCRSTSRHLSSRTLAGNFPAIVAATLAVFLIGTLD
jgi:hypothetical protein